MTNYILAGMVVVGIILIMMIAHVISEISDISDELLELRAKSELYGDDSNHPNTLNMDFSWNKPKRHKPVRFTDKSKRWILDRENASRR